MNLNFFIILSYLSFGPCFFDFSVRESPRAFEIKSLVHNFFCYSADSSVLPLPLLSSSLDYNTVKKNIKIKKQFFLSEYNKAKSENDKLKVIDEASVYLTTQMVKNIFPHWYGTKWSFDGYTAVPNKGEVGCSYFVSTTLLHAGFNLNRYTLAQQGPHSEAISLKVEEDMIEIESEIDLKGFIPAVKKKCKEGLYFIGLGHSHVGFIYVREQEVYFIQSSYGHSMQVEIDYARDSDILSGFTSFVLVPLTTNESLMKKWIKGEEVLVVKGKE